MVLNLEHAPVDCDDEERTHRLRGRPTPTACSLARWRPFQSAPRFAPPVPGSKRPGWPTRKGLRRSARRAGNPSATSLSVRMVNSPVRCPTRLRHGAVRRGQLEQHCRDRAAVSIHISGDHGWFVAHWGDTYVAQPGGERRSRKGYITCVLERRNGEWKARMHTTFPSAQ